MAGRWSGRWSGSPPQAAGEPRIQMVEAAQPGPAKRPTFWDEVVVVRSSTADPVRHKPMSCFRVNPLDNISVGPPRSPTPSSLPLVLEQ